MEELCEPSEKVRSELWWHYQAAHPHLEQLPFTALNALARELTLRVLVEGRRRGREVEGEEGGRRCCRGGSTGRWTRRWCV